MSTPLDDEAALECEVALLEALARDRELLANAAWEEIARNSPAYGELPAAQVEGVQQTISLTIATLLTCLREHRPLNSRELGFLNDLGHRRFRQGIPLDGLIAGFRVASEAGYRLLGEHARRLPLSPAVVEAQTVISTRLLGLLHDVLGAVTAGYGETAVYHVSDRLRAEAILVEDILEGLSTDADTLRTRACNLGYDLGRACGMFLVVSDEHTGDIAQLRRALDALASSLDGAIPGPSYAVPQPYALALVPLEDCRVEGWQRVLDQAAEAAEEISVRLVAFGPVQSPGELVGLHRQALDALSVLEAASQSRRVLIPDDLWPFHALNRVDDGSAVRLVRASIGALLAQRRDRAREAFRTLVAVFEHPDREAAAAALHVSPKGLQYRLGRIKDLTGLDPSVARDRLRLDLSTVFLRLHPSMPPPGDDAWQS